MSSLVEEISPGLRHRALQVLGEWSELCRSVTPRDAVTRPLITVTRFMRVGAKLVRLVEELAEVKAEIESDHIPAEEMIKVTRNMRREPDFVGKYDQGVEWLRRETDTSREIAGSWLSEAQVWPGEPRVHQIASRGRKEVTIRLLTGQMYYEIWIS